MSLSAKAAKFLEMKPTYMGRQLGNDFYECPWNGDEAPLWMITTEGKLKKSDFWEVPSVDEMIG